MNTGVNTRVNTGVDNRVNTGLNPYYQVTHCKFRLFSKGFGKMWNVE